MKRGLIIGNGGREHALAWKLRQSSQVGDIFVAPGNGGTESLGQNIDIQPNDFEGLLNFARQQHIDLIVVGPELPLAQGISDYFQAEGLQVFGPSQAAARLETSKIFAKEFMSRHNIPTAPYRVASRFDEAQQHIREMGIPVVIKADGLAAGKGVTVCQTIEQAEEAAHQALVAGIFGEAGRKVIVEAALSGQEVSILAFCDRNIAKPMIAAQDHKAAFDGDKGPNTGGMGCYAPAPFLDDSDLQKVTQTILQPAVDGMRAEGAPYRGVLYAGLMLTEAGPQVLEFNVRFGDPETQVILPLLESDLPDILRACIEDRLHEVDIQWLPEACVCVICASPGYPDDYPKGLPITGLENVKDENVMIFHAGTRRENGQLFTSGGRVLGVTCRAVDLQNAIDGAYGAIDPIYFEGMHYRRDIGAKGLGS